MNQRNFAWHVRGLLLVACLLPTACDSSSSDSDDSPSDEIATADIGPTGGTLEVLSGELAGFKFVVPAGALSTTREFKVRRGIALAGAGVEIVGPGAQLEPDNLTLATPAELSIPYLPGTIPASSTPDDVVVVYVDPDGDTIRQLTPLRINTTTAVAVVSVRERFNLYWCAVPTGAATSFGSYFPFAQRAQFTFDSGASVVIEPALAAADRATSTAGLTATGPGFALELLVDDMGDAARHGRRVDGVLFRQAEPFAGFADIIEWELVDRGHATTFWLARGIGPVRIRHDDGAVHTVTGASRAGRDLLRD